MPFNAFFGDMQFKMEKVSAQKLPASWYYNTYSSDLMQDSVSFEELIGTLSNNQSIPTFEEAQFPSSVYDGLLNQDFANNFPKCDLKQNLIKRYFSEENISQKNIEFGYYGFRYEKRDLVWGLTQILNSGLVEMGLSSRLEPISLSNAKEYIRKSRQFEWSVPGDKKLEKYLQKKSNERSW